MKYITHMIAAGIGALAALIFAAVILAQWQVNTYQPNLEEQKNLCMRTWVRDWPANNVLHQADPSFGLHSLPECAGLSENDTQEIQNELIGYLTTNGGY